jgi:hypothetical protein
MPLTLSSTPPTTTMVNTLNVPFVMWVIPPSSFSNLSPVLLQPLSFTSVNSNFVTAWVQQNTDQTVLMQLQVYPQGYMAGSTFLASTASTPIGGGGSTPAPGSPVVTNASIFFNTAGVLQSGQTIGTASATNTPTSWALTSGTSNFSISNVGAITLTTSGTALDNTSSGTQTLNVTASNALGSGTGVITINLFATIALSGLIKVHTTSRASGSTLTTRQGLFASAAIMTRFRASGTGL